MSDDRLRRLGRDARDTPGDGSLVVTYLVGLMRAGQEVFACPGSWTAKHRVRLWAHAKRKRALEHTCSGKAWWTFMVGGKRDPSNKRTTNFGEAGRYYLVPCQPKGAGWWFDHERALAFDTSDELLGHVAERLVEWQEIVVRATTAAKTCCVHDEGEHLPHVRGAPCGFCDCGGFWRSA